MPSQAEIRQEFGISPTARTTDSERLASLTSPSMTGALQMIDRFFASSGTNFTFLNKSVLTAALQDLSSERRTSQLETKRALLYMVFALSQTATSDPSSTFYFDQSMKLLTPARLRSANLTLGESVQLISERANHARPSPGPPPPSKLPTAESDVCRQLDMSCPGSESCFPTWAALSHQLQRTLHVRGCTANKSLV